MMLTNLSGGPADVAFKLVVESHCKRGVGVGLGVGAMVVLVVMVAVLSPRNRPCFFAGGRASVGTCGSDADTGDTATGCRSKRSNNKLTGMLATTSTSNPNKRVANLMMVA